jgi:hypothetical protein
LHELLDSQRVTGVLVAQHLGKFDLVVEQQAVFTPSGQDVLAESHSPEKILALLEAL